MAIFLILAPYGAFASLMLLTSAKAGVFAAAAIGLAVIALDFIRGRSLKWLGAGSAVLFAALGLYLTLIDPSLGNSAVKLSIDTGIFTISLTSMLIGRPFTLQYAREAVAAETAAMPGFLRANYIITAAWTAAALVMMVANLAMLYVPGLPRDIPPGQHFRVTPTAAPARTVFAGTSPQTAPGLRGNPANRTDHHRPKETTHDFPRHDPAQTFRGAGRHCNTEREETDERPSGHR